MSEHVLKNENVHGQCISTEASPRITIYRRNTKCDFKIEITKRDASGLFCTDFVIRNVSATCQYRCAASQSYEIKSVAVAGM